MDYRDIKRLGQFISKEQLNDFNLALKDPKDYQTHINIPFTKENILRQLEEDVAFGFEKALGCRGISSLFMYNVVQMWNWILEEEDLENFDEYEYYGLPLFKATALKYRFPNPIGTDSGHEERYYATGENSNV